MPLPESLYPRLYAYCTAGLSRHDALQLLYLEVAREQARDKLLAIEPPAPAAVLEVTSQASLRPPEAVLNAAG